MFQHRTFPAQPGREPSPGFKPTFLALLGLPRMGQFLLMVAVFLAGFTVGIENRPESAAPTAPLPAPAPDPLPALVPAPAPLLVPLPTAKTCAMPAGTAKPSSPVADDEARDGLDNGPVVAHPLPYAPAGGHTAHLSTASWPLGVAAMKGTVYTLYREYLDRTGNDASAAAALTRSFAVSA